MGKANTFNYAICHDPMRMKDEQLFGKWDEQTNTWIQEGIFNYKRYEDALEPVIVQVKSGNYLKARDALLTYYQRKYADLLSEWDKYLNEIKIKEHGGIPDSADTDELRCAALERNVYSVGVVTGFPAGFLNMDAEYKWCGTDVLLTINRVISKKLNYVCYQLMSVDKSDNTARVYSGKSEYKPYLELIVNGEVVQISCAKDTMLSAGENADQNFSHLEQFEVRESGCYHSHDERMKRAYFVFDLSSLKDTDEIASAKLYFYGNCDRDTKELYIYNDFQESWEEDTFCWNDLSDEFLFSCNDVDSWDYITSPFPQIKGKICTYQRGDELTPLVRRYRKTGDEKYAYTFIRNLMATVYYVGCSREIYNELDMARYCDNFTQNLIWTMDSKYMKAEYFCAALKNLYRIAGWLVENHYGKMKNNWASFGTRGVYTVYSFFQELKVYDEWKEKTVLENSRLLKYFTNPDGSCIELSNSYQNTLINTMIPLGKICEMTGESIPLTEEGYAVLGTLFKSYYYTLSPTYSDFNVGDATGPFEDLRKNIKRWYAELPEIMEQDEELLYVVTDGKKGKMPDFTTMHFPDNKRIYMKTDWTTDALAMTVTGKVTGSHGHRDVYSLAMMAYGRHLLTDQGYGAILTGPTTELMYASQSHNVLLADDTENLGKTNSRIKPAPQLMKYYRDAQERYYYTDDKYDLYELTGANNPVVAQQNRCVLFCKKQRFWIVTDYIKPVDTVKETKYTLYWHMLPDAGMSIQDNGRIVRSNFEDGINVIVAVAEYDRLDGAVLQDSLYAPCSGVLRQSKKACLIRNVKGQVTFTSIIVPVNKGEEFDVFCETLDSGNADVNACRIEITNKNGEKSTYYFGHNNADDGRYRVGDFETKSAVFFAQVDENDQVIEEFIYD